MDERGLFLADPDHSEAEEEIRIISARKATPKEERTYAERWKR